MANGNGEKNGKEKNGKVRKPMMKLGDSQLVRAVLSSFRKTKEADLELDARHVAEVVEALRISGFVIVPRGVLDSIRKILGAYENGES